MFPTQHRNIANDLLYFLSSLDHVLVMTMGRVDGDDVGTGRHQCLRAFHVKWATSGADTHAGCYCFSHHIDLSIDRQVAMDNAETTKLTKGNGHCRLGDFVHWGGNNGVRNKKIPRAGGLGRGFKRLNVAFGWFDEYIIKRQILLYVCHARV